VNSDAAEILSNLLEGNKRFSTGHSTHYRYSPEEIARLGNGQKPKAAIVACIDGRVSPEIIFDQPLTNLFVSRVPGNVASDSAKWMLEIAVTDLHVPLVIVLGHTECLAIKQVIEGVQGSGGVLRSQVERSLAEARMKAAPDLFRECVCQNAIRTGEILMQESYAVRQAVDKGQLNLVAGLYDVHTGRVRILDTGPD
jgi:carbonic anhydrase